MSKPTRTIPAPSLTLRVLETTDVHGNLLDYDYFGNHGNRAYGLVRVATLIAAARAEARNSLLFDNGDFLQGTPLTDLTARPGSGWDGPHPVLTAMNHLRYDAAALGNHEFNFGLDWLQSTLQEADFPVLCSNVDLPGKGFAPILPHVILTRPVTDHAGHLHRLRIGLLGLVPPQITTWDRDHLQDRLTSRDMVAAARDLVPDLRARGADLVIALAHTGIAAAPTGPGAENAARGLADLPGLDAILAGHSHKCFPGPGHDGIDGVDSRAGTLGRVPAVMAGFRASHLGVLDLHVALDLQGRWQVTGHDSHLRSVAPEGGRIAPPCPALVQELSGAHDHTLRLSARPIGHSDVPLHSYLALLRNDPAMQLVTSAQCAALRDMVAGTAHDGLALLSASAPFRTGGRGGPQHYTDVPAGPLLLRHVADLYGFPNTLCALCVTGAQLRDWLERAAICFNRITPGLHDQPLLDPQVPGHDFDVMDGLTYTIDPSQPARFDLTGRLVAPDAHRIQDLHHAGQPVDPSARFLLATNNYRAFGGGPFAPLGQTCLVQSDRRLIRDILAKHIAETGPPCTKPRRIWRFRPLPDTTVTFDTGPGITAYPEDLQALRATVAGRTPAGFLRLRMAMHGPPCESGA